MNKGEERETTIGGRIIKVKAGKNWLPKGTAEFITSKIPFTNTEGISIECADDGTPIDEIQQGVKNVVIEEPIKKEEVEKVEVEKEEVVVDKIISEVKEPVTEEDLKKYEEELETKTREELISILDFKEIKFGKNDNNKKLIKTIIKATK